MKPDATRVIVNGQTQEIRLPCSVSQFLGGCGWKSTQVVVEYNGKVLPRSELEAQMMQIGDRLEIIVPVAGG